MASSGISRPAAVAGALAAAVATALAGAACTAGRPGADAGHPSSPPPSRLTVATAHGGEVVSDVISLLSPRVGFVGLGDSASSLNGRAELVRTTDGGATFTDLGPRTAPDTEPDSIFFLDRTHGWFATFSVVTLGEIIYRTRDGGRTWRGFAAPVHALAAGSGDSLQFISPSRGWLVDTQPTAPAEDLYATTDGGATWHRVASFGPRRPGGPGVLPEMGRIEFEPNGRTGWLGGGMFSRTLFKTSDGGRTWRRAGLRLPGSALAGLPAVFGPRVVEPVTVDHHGEAELRSYASSDGGRTWSLTSALPAAGRVCLGPLPTTIPDRAVGWAAAYRHHRVTVFVTDDLGGGWAARTVPAPVPRGSCGPERILATTGASAWLVTPGRPASPTQIWATADEGRSWHRIDLAALAAR